jgi:hypothetical protein
VDRSVVIELEIKFGWAWMQTVLLGVSSVNLKKPPAGDGNMGAVCVPMNGVSRLRQSCVISSFRRKIDETFALLGYYAAYSGNFLPTFRDNF